MTLLPRRIRQFGRCAHISLQHVLLCERAIDWHLRGGCHSIKTQASAEGPHFWEWLTRACRLPIEFENFASNIMNNCLAVWSAVGLLALDSPKGLFVSIQRS